MNAIWGAAGYVGSGIFDPARHDAIFHSDKVTQPGQKLSKEWSGIVWCAGWPGKKNVDEVQSNPIRSYLQNVAEPIELVNRCISQNKRILLLSSGCIFNGLKTCGKPHTENDLPNFLQTVYLGHKRRMEESACNIMPAVTIFRIRVPFDGRHHSRNTLHKLAQMTSVWDAEQSYTWIPDLARAVRLWEDGRIDGGIWHVTQSGTMNNYDAVKEGFNPQVGRISGGDRPESTMACPRSTAILDSSKLGALMPLTPVKEAWAKAVLEYRSHLALP